MFLLSYMLLFFSIQYLLKTMQKRTFIVNVIFILIVYLYTFSMFLPIFMHNVPPHQKKFCSVSPYFPIFILNLWLIFSFEIAIYSIENMI